MQDTLRQLIAQDPNGLLRPEAVVQAAQDPNSLLHTYFEWDDDEAAAKWRLEQARHLIKSVQVFIEPLNIRIRAFTSLDMDRGVGGGFRLMSDVMANPDLKNQMLVTALRELQSMESKYAHLEELAKVWNSAHAIEAKVKRSHKVTKR